MTSPGPLGQEISLSWWVYNNALLFMQGFIQDFLVGGGGGSASIGHWPAHAARVSQMLYLLLNAFVFIKIIIVSMKKQKKGWALKKRCCTLLNHDNMSKF